MKEILKILNQEPFDMYPHKAEQIAEILINDREKKNVIRAYLKHLL